MNSFNPLHLLKQVLFFLIMACFLMACKNTTTQPKKVVDHPPTYPIEKQDSLDTSLYKEKEAIKSPALGKTPTDTLRFIAFDDTNDYWYFTAHNSTDTLNIIYHADFPIHELSAGDALIINWELKTLEEAGDPEFSYQKPYLLSFEKMGSKSTAPESVKIYWREQRYDETLQTTVSNPILNNHFLKHISAQEKAALGYVASRIGNACVWDGSPNADRSNLKCSILSALDLGYQCSETQLNFLKQWFAQDPNTLEQLAMCKTIPNTATVQSMLEELHLVTDTETQTITLTYEYGQIHIREGQVLRFTKTDRFYYDETQIVRMEPKRDNLLEYSKIKSFAISCGSGCAMTYYESKSTVTPESTQITFMVNLYENDTETDAYYETYSFDRAADNAPSLIHTTTGAKPNSRELHSRLQEKLRDYANAFRIDY
jgi:hypothetical protein